MKIKDFLESPSVGIDGDSVKKHFNGKTVLVTGGAGYIGSRLCHMLFEVGARKVIAMDIDDTRLHELWLEMDENKPFVSCLGDVKDLIRVEEIFNEYEIDIVFHASAIKHVPLAELYPRETIKVNVLGTQNILKVGLPKIKQLIHISTDKAADAIGVMGKTKKTAEVICTAYGEQEKKKVMSVRFGNIYGSRGSVVPIFEKKLRNGQSIQVTDVEMERYFIKAEDAIRLTLQACVLNRNPDDVFVFDMGEPIRILDIANHLMSRSGMTSGVEIIGKRPGEKISEVLTSYDEKKLKTSHHKIFRIQRSN